jgi:methylase of polypeptide subunit release factors
VIAQHRLGEDGHVLDMGTGSGVCAVFAARRSYSCFASREAIRSPSR